MATFRGGLPHHLSGAVGRHNVWLAGMYTHDADCHESAIISAVNIARRLAPASELVGRLMASGGAERADSPQVPGTQR